MSTQISDSKPVLLIRADATPAAGAGHVARCLALAEAWTAAGGSSEIIGKVEFGWLAEMLSERGIGHVDPDVTTSGPDDAEFLRHRINESKPAWTILDGYGFRRNYRESIEGLGALGIVDDLADEMDYRGLDLVVNHGLHASELAYANADTECRVLTGPKWALLRSDFWEGTPRTVSPGAIRVLVTLGGSAGETEIQRIAAILEENGLETVTATGGNLAGALQDVDIAVTAAGTTCWEVLSLGIPLVVVAVADNQVPVAKSLAAGGYAIWVDAADDHARITDEVIGLSKDPERAETLRRRGSALVDGGGALRVVQIMRGDPVWLRRSGGTASRHRFEILDGDDHSIGKAAVSFGDTGAISFEDWSTSADETSELPETVAEMVRERVRYVERRQAGIPGDLAESDM